jgi:DNA (cytosine-5)-methyltransferase 1
MASDKIRVVELFAGVGGFRLGLEGWKGKSASSGYTELFDSPFEVVWSNQHEPHAKVQYASDVYRYRWPDSHHSDEDVEEIADPDKGPGRVESLPDHQMLVGGFPCQDYSVANTLKRAEGILGKKGVLWWQIHSILKRLGNAGKPTRYLMLENVDRLLKSPRGQRGRDFAIMLQSLNRLGYAVEWRVINAAEYGMPQRRRRVFILAYHESTEIYERFAAQGGANWLNNHSVITAAFPVSDPLVVSRPSESVNLGLTGLTEKFGSGKSDASRPFKEAGVMIDGQVWTSKYKAPELTEEQRSAIALRNYLVHRSASKKFWVDKEVAEDDKKGWLAQKNSKARERVDKITGHSYQWSEGSMDLDDDLDRPARTIITSEGLNTPSRTTHLIKVGEHYRRLTPVELEKLSMFPPTHTRLGRKPNGEIYKIPRPKRAFFIGNALVAGVVERLGLSLIKAEENAQQQIRSQIEEEHEIFMSDSATV